MPAPPPTNPPPPCLVVHGVYLPLAQKPQPLNGDRAFKAKVRYVPTHPPSSFLVCFVVAVDRAGELRMDGRATKEGLSNWQESNTVRVTGRQLSQPAHAPADSPSH